VPISIGGLTGVRQADAGIASGLINTSQQIGGAIGVAAATTIATTFTTRFVDVMQALAARWRGADARLRDRLLRPGGRGALGALVAAVLVESNPVAPEVEVIDGQVVQVELAA
jgi:hypothetical protein